jgi:NAD(P)-dependent dehydrogenase (short-subunit alcohol dehydrogenase family)
VRPPPRFLSSRLHRTDARHAAFQADLSTVEALRALHTDVVRTLGDVDVLFVNHGLIGHMLGRGGNIEDLDYAVFESTWRANTAPAFLVRV